MDWGDGGGFIPGESIAEEPQQLTASVSVGGEDKNKSIAAVSISQIVKLTHINDGLVIHGKKVYHVNLVAFVYEILDINPQKIHILLDDFTCGAPLEVNHIIGDVGTPGEDPSLSMFQENVDAGISDQPRALQNIRVGDYVRCIGVVKYSQDKPNLIAYNLRFVEDPNEVTMHTLEVIRDSMYFARLQTGAAAPLQTSHVDNKSATRGFMQESRDDFGKLSTREKHLLKFLKEKSPATGMSVDSIAANFKAFSRADIEASLITLNSEGLCWNGDSEDIWCVQMD